MAWAGAIAAQVPAPLPDLTMCGRLAGARLAHDQAHSRKEHRNDHELARGHAPADGRARPAAGHGHARLRGPEAGSGRRQQRATRRRPTRSPRAGCTRSPATWPWNSPGTRSGSTRSPRPSSLPRSTRGSSPGTSSGRPCTASTASTRWAGPAPPATWPIPSPSCSPRPPAGSPAPSGTSTVASWPDATSPGALSASWSKGEL
jgi:hypothetical protein